MVACDCCAAGYGIIDGQRPFRPLYQGQAAFHQLARGPEVQKTAIRHKLHVEGMARKAGYTSASISSEQVEPLARRASDVTRGRSGAAHGAANLAIQVQPMPQNPLPCLAGKVEAIEQRRRRGCVQAHHPEVQRGFSGASMAPAALCSSTDGFCK